MAEAFWENLSQGRGEGRGRLGIIDIRSGKSGYIGYIIEWQQFKWQHLWQQIGNILAT
jgi:hypothetical protein